MCNPIGRHFRRTGPRPPRPADHHLGRTRACLHHRHQPHCGYRSLCAGECRRSANRQPLVQDGAATGCALRRGRHRGRTHRRVRRLRDGPAGPPTAHPHPHRGRVPAFLQGRILPLRHRHPPALETLGGRTAAGAGLLARRAEDSLRARQQPLCGGRRARAAGDDRRAV